MPFGSHLTLLCACGASTKAELQMGVPVGSVFNIVVSKKGSEETGEDLGEFHTTDDGFDPPIGDHVPPGAARMLTKFLQGIDPNELPIDTVDWLGSVEFHDQVYKVMWFTILPF